MLGGAGAALGVGAAAARSPDVVRPAADRIVDEELLITPDEAVHGAALPVSKPGLPSSAGVHPPPLPEPTAQENVVLPEAPVVSVAVTVTDEAEAGTRVRRSPTHNARCLRPNPSAAGTC